MLASIGDGMERKEATKTEKERISLLTPEERESIAKREIGRGVVIYLNKM